MSSGNSGDNHHLVARLEAFSDIVIGFSLAETTVNLVVTKGLANYFAHPLGIIAYLGTFFIVARLWWAHSNIMHRYFELNRVMIAVNFIALAAIGLMVFSLQLLLHQDSNDSAEFMLAVRFYFVTFTAAFGSIAVMRLLGVQYRWAHLRPEERRDGTSRSLTTLAVCVPVIVAALLPSSTVLFGFDVQVVPANMFFAFLAGGILSAIVKRIFKKTTWGLDATNAAHAG